MMLALRRARAATNTAPTLGQKEAGNYAMGLVRVHGLEVRIENPKGSIRSGVGRDGTPWSVRMANDYGYIRRTEGADGDGVDVFLGPRLESELVFVVDQVVGGRFDEHKVILGATSEEEARDIYLSNYSPGWRGLGTITALPIAEFKRWLVHHDTTKPMAPARSVVFKALVLKATPRDPGSRGGIGYRTSSGKWRYGRAPLLRDPRVAQGVNNWPAVMAAQIVHVSPGELAHLGARELIAEARRVYFSLAPAQNRADGRTVEFVRSTFKKLRHHAADRSALEVVPALPSLIRAAVPLYDVPDRGGRPELHWRIYLARAVYRGDPVFVRLTTREERGREYLHFYDTLVATEKETLHASPLQLSKPGGRAGAIYLLATIAGAGKRRLPVLKARGPLTARDLGGGRPDLPLLKANPSNPRQLPLFSAGSIKQNPENRLGVDRIGRPHWVAPPEPVRPMRQVRLALGSTAAAASDFKHFPAPGAVDEAGNPIAQPAAWEVSEGEFVEEMARRAVQRAVRNAEGWARRLAEVKPPTRPAKFGLSKYDEARLNVEHWTKRAEELRQRGVSDKEREKYREEYLQTVKKAISSGKPVPVAVIAQRPEFATARNARARYEKGRHTAFANESIAVNRSLKSERGFKVKRQDGKPIPHEQVEEIARGVSEVESVIGSLKDLLDWSDLTIAHTNGKHPFLSHYGGLYHGKTEHALGGNVISMGTTGVRALAHELGHWLDFESGRALGIEMRVWRNYKGRGVMSTALTDNESHSWRGRSDYFEQFGRPTDVIDRARARINNVLAVRRTFQKDAKEGKTPLEVQQIEQRRVHLGPYWREPIEVFARLVEQYVATELAARHTPAEVAADADYTSSAGWWKAEDFEAFRPMVKQEIERRLGILRAQIAAGVPVAKARLGEMLRRILRPKGR